MPTYDYRCTCCSDTFEVSRPMGSTESPSCPACGADARRVFTPVGVAFKGAGFHSTDYRPRAVEDTGSCPAKSASSEKCASCPAAE